MRKDDLLARLNRTDKKLLDLGNSGRKIHMETLTCKDLERLNKAFDILYELFDKCMVENKK